MIIWNLEALQKDSGESQADYQVSGSRGWKMENGASEG